MKEITTIVGERKSNVDGGFATRILASGMDRLLRKIRLKDKDNAILG